jgi:hypothetical protein
MIVTEEEGLDEFTLAWLQREQEINEAVADGHKAIDLQADEAWTYIHAWLSVAASRLTATFPGLLPHMRAVQELGSDTPPHGFPPVEPDAVTGPIVFAGELTATSGGDPGFPDSLLPDRDDIGDIIASLRPPSGPDDGS